MATPKLAFLPYPPEEESKPSRTAGLSLFWRTFVLLSLLLVGSVFAWTQTLRELESEPRAIQTARQIASLVNLSRAAVMYTDAITRVSLFKTMRDEEHVVIVPREPKDLIEPMENGELNRFISEELTQRLGPGTMVAGRVNGKDGLWIGFTIDKDLFWLQTNLERFDTPAGKTWLIWLTTAAALSLAGAAWIARLINRPLKDLSFAASRVREGDFEASELDESVATSEIREVNVGFNRMTQKLAMIEQERAVMLAGISHDLRTPLARLRLETELSVTDIHARENMASDIAQLDAIIGKFLDYARPGNMELTAVSLNKTVETCLLSLKKRPDIAFKVAMEDRLLVMADEVELQRIITNLLENAARYGKSMDTGMADIEISARGLDKQVLLRLRDHGQGVAADQLKQLTTPFFRGEAARTSANGTGLGLSIVEKTVSRMGGKLELSNANSGGLCANIRLQRAPAGST
ncbi:sensor histidine kinase RcsC [Rhodoferax lithotrophicus]|uniref:histidine kinase n=1 Tax=Rhodoferax lithotrophicus TaxID=2798804 RepID=A0ABM7MQ78_9BURK|nr:sensor histidine kinase [Rhodoferax sp. MIZ03]BCO28476.1 sensor histidine kinase RcsC [Rhodoferax sp. MIZ03]